MSRRSTILRPTRHDGASQRGRSLPALDADYVAIDERSAADVLAFVQAFAGKLRYFDAGGDAGELVETDSWQAFAHHPEVSIADMVAYMREPERFTGERARWLGRPHFALLLAFVELLQHARAQLGDLTRRHLDYYYRDILQMEPQPARPDRAAVVFRLAPRVAPARLPAGTALEAGRDSSGAVRIYRTERDLIISRAQVADMRSVFVHRRSTGISDVRADRSLTAREALEGTLRIALGVPRPGAPVPRWRGAAIDLDFLTGLRGPLELARTHLFLEHHELRALMQRVHRRDAADHEWAEINRLLGVVDPARPRDFAGNLASRVGALDFKKDGLPQVSDIDDVYEHRTEPDVRRYIDVELEVIGYDHFVALMPIKLRIDAEWAEINRLLERAGRRRRGELSWSLAGSDPGRFDPTSFLDNLARALGSAWPPPWPWDTQAIAEYERRLRQLEEHLSMPVERLERLVAFAEASGHASDAHSLDWSEIDRVLAGAHREQVYARRRAELADVRGARASLAGFDAVVGFVLGDRPDESMAWSDARASLAQYLGTGQLTLLDGFREQLAQPGVAAGRFDWPDVYRVLELAWRYVEGMPEPVPRTTEWRNLYAYQDALTQRSDATASPCWKTFGRPLVPGQGPVDPQDPPAPVIGWALGSPMLALSQGTRTITLTLGFTGDSFDVPSFLGALGLGGEEGSGDVAEPALRAALAGAWVVEVSTAKGWIELELAQARLAMGTPGDDYWSLRGAARALGEDRPALQLVVVAGVSHDALAPARGADQPMLRLLLRQRWDAKGREWTTSLAPFEPLELAAVHLQVAVEGLSELHLQHGDRVLDPRKPFEPFGSQPAAGSRLYLGHPELLRERLDMLRFHIEWMGLPDSLASHYANYPGITGGASFAIHMALVERNAVLSLGDAALFEDASDTGETLPARTVTIAGVPAALELSSPGFVYTRRLDLAAGGDLRAASRHVYWELGSPDFGHGSYPSLAARKAGELSVAIATGAFASGSGAGQAADYQISTPYTPTIKRLSVAYRTSLELDPRAPAHSDRLLHVHPFGVAPIDDRDPSFLPRYDQAGELYIGLVDLEPPQRVALLVQLAEGTSDPDLEPAPVSWSYLDGDRWRDLGDGHVLHDSTRGLINSGIVELDVPGAAPSTRLPGELYWLQVAIPRSPASVCDTVDIRAQAVMVRLGERGSAADHYQQPLPVGSIERLVEPDGRIAAVEQPFTSFGGKPPERAELFYTRISERLRHRGRALCPWDYERLVLERFGHIYKAKCLPASATREPGRVEVIVIPDIRHALPGDVFAPKVAANLLADIQAYLGERAPAVASVSVRNARYVPVLVRLGVRFVSGVDAGFARTQLDQDLVRFLSPWAYDEGAELMIGGKIYATSILDFVDRRDYVDYVAELKLFRGRGGDDFELIPPSADYHVATEGPDEVLVAARRHHIDVISEVDYQQAFFTGIDYMKLELDFIVG